MKEYYVFLPDSLPQLHFVNDTVITPPYIHKKRKADEYILYAVKSGEMYLKEEEDVITLRAGDIVILDKNRTHYGLKASTCEYYYLHFQFSEFQFKLLEEKEVIEKMLSERQEAIESDLFSYESCIPHLLYLPKYLHISDRTELLSILTSLESMKKESYNSLEHYKMIGACNLLTFFITMSRLYLSIQSKEYHHKIYLLMEWIGENYNTEITSDQIASLFQNNYDYLNRLFKKATNQTIFQYITKIRIEHAKNLLLHTSLNMHDIGEQVGYLDEYYFSRVFKKSVGIPPATYAKNARKVVIR